MLYLVYGTAWMSTVLFVLSRIPMSIMPGPSKRMGHRQLQRLLDWAGLIILWFHIGLAYAGIHHGSHAAAVEHVARRTEEFTGIRTGAGIYANFAVAFLWPVSAYLREMRFRSSTPGQPRIVVALPCQFECMHVLVELFLWLMFACAAIVFAQTMSAIVFGCIFLSAVLIILRVYFRERHLGSM